MSDAAKTECPGCVETRRLVDFTGMPVMLPHEWLPAHREGCPAAKPVKFGGMDVWTYAEPAAQ